MDISKIDKNFAVPGIGETMDVKYYDVRKSPLALEGLPWRKNSHKFFKRIPDTFTEKNTNAGVISLGVYTAGAAVRFRSDSRVIVLRGKLGPGSDMSHMPRAGSIGFDSYVSVNGSFPVYQKTYQSPRPGPDAEYKCIIGENFKGVLCDWIINLPLYGGVQTMEIGVEKGASILPPLPHKYTKPVLFYGSSITEGGCASRPGNNYTSLLCREVDAEQINFGFSGSARGEKAVAEAIASLDLAAFVYDYDYNTPTPEHLLATHEPFFRIIRKAHPELPVIMLSKCSRGSTSEADQKKRKEIIRQTWRNAVKAGDKNVYFIDGETLFGTAKQHPDACTVDGCHPNDLGFYRMFVKTLPVLRKALANAEKSCKNEKREVKINRPKGKKK